MWSIYDLLHLSVFFPLSVSWLSSLLSLSPIYHLSSFCHVVFVLSSPYTATAALSGIRTFFPIPVYFLIITSASVSHCLPPASSPSTTRLPPVYPPSTTSRLFSRSFYPRAFPFRCFTFSCLNDITPPFPLLPIVFIIVSSSTSTCSRDILFFHFFPCIVTYFSSYSTFPFLSLYI